MCPSPIPSDHVYVANKQTYLMQPFNNILSITILLLQINIHAKVFIPKVVPEIPEGQSVPKVFQVCVCASGKLYAADDCESKFDQYC